MSCAPGELDDLTAADLSGATAITASALLDMLTAVQLQRLGAACTGTGAMLLFTGTVTGGVHLEPADRLDAPLRLAFNGHQRRAGLLGPGAAAHARDTLTSVGYRVTTRHAPWRLGPANLDLSRTWLEGWVAAAVDERPALRPAAARYLRRRAEQLDRGELRVVVDNVDLFAAPDRTVPT
jgi:hypothetical protein